MANTTITPRMIERKFERMVNFGEIDDARLRSAAETALAMADGDRGVFFRTAARLVNGFPDLEPIAALEVLTKLGQSLAFSREDDVRAAAAAAAAAGPDDAGGDADELVARAFGLRYVSFGAGDGVEQAGGDLLGDQVDQGDQAGEHKIQGLGSQGIQDIGV